MLAAHEALRDTVIRFYAARRRAGDTAIHFIDGNALIPFGARGAYSDNGVHPTSVGFAMMAQALIPSLERILFAPD